MTSSVMTTEQILQWAYADQCVDRNVGLEAAEVAADGKHRRQVSMTAKIGEIANLGCAVDGGGAVSLGRIPDDALTVAQAVDRLDRHARALVIHCAKTRSRPDWLETIAEFRLVPDRDEDGRLCVLSIKNGGTASNHLNFRRSYVRDPNERNVRAWGVKSVGTSPALIREAEEQWLLWWASLLDVHYFLKAPSRLKDKQVCGLGVEREPWSGGRWVTPVSMGIDCPKKT